jgi:hypothetical protein
MGIRFKTNKWRFTMKLANNTRLYVTDWNSQGCNDLVIVKEYGLSEESIEVVPEATFGIDIAKYDMVKLYDGFEEIDVAEVDFKTVISKIAISPVTSAASQYKAIIEAINSEPEVYEVEEIEL